MTRIGTDDTNHAMAANNLALATNALDRSLNSHFFLRNNCLSTLLRSEYDSRLIKVIRRQLYRNLVAGKNPNVVHTHLPGYMSKDDVPVFQLYPECCIGEVFKNLALHFDDVFFRH